MNNVQNKHKALRGNRIRTGKDEQGAILVFCLIFLAVLTMMGVSGMESTILEERMASNMRDQSMAFQAAESALKEGESWLNANVTAPAVSSDGSTQVWPENALDPDQEDLTYWWHDSSTNGVWWRSNGVSLQGFEGLATQPQYIIEEFHTSGSGRSIGVGNGETDLVRVFHRITARGTGATETAEVLLQSTFVKPYE